MRSYILTEKDRELMDAYLEQGLKLYNFEVMVHRVNKLKLDEMIKGLERIKDFKKKANR